MVYKKKTKTKKLNFTGERLIPQLNKGAAFYYEHLARYLFASQFVNEKKVLDAGCGVGYGDFILATIGKAKKVHAVDISQDAIDYGKNMYLHENIEFRKDDILKLKTIPDSSIDVSVCFEVIEHIDDQDEFLTQIKRVLKKNGIFIVSTPNKYNYPEGNIFHKKELYPEEFFKLLKKYFKNVSLYHQNFEFANLFKPDKLKKSLKLDENFSFLTSKIYTKPTDPKKSQYIICICGDVKIIKPNLLTLTSDKIDGFDLTSGFSTLGEQFKKLYVQIDDWNKKISEKYQKPADYEKNIEVINKLSRENQMIKNQIKQIKIENEKLLNILKKIKSAKFFKLWQGYCKIRDKIFQK